MLIIFCQPSPNVLFYHGFIVMQGSVCMMDPSDIMLDPVSIRDVKTDLNT